MDIVKSFKHKEFHPNDKPGKQFKHKELSPVNKIARQQITKEKNLKTKAYAKFKNEELCLERCIKL